MGQMFGQLVAAMEERDADNLGDLFQGSCGSACHALMSNPSVTTLNSTKAVSKCPMGMKIEILRHQRERRQRSRGATMNPLDFSGALLCLFLAALPRANDKET